MPTPPTNEPPRRDEPTTEKILIVDDERDVEWLFRQRFRRELRRGELDFAFAFSGAEALRYLRSGSAAGVVLVLSDINMPGMTGLELLKHIKAEHPELKVVMITAYGDERNHQRALSYGADDYFTKPIDFESLKQQVAPLRSKP
ncbi:MAG: response regulator [Bacteroidetes bacterium]|jgi:CheY-like chemotaxis protein|nr:response regulator [Bacteroidota bacterium]